MSGVEQQVVRVCGIHGTILDGSGCGDCVAGRNQLLALIEEREGKITALKAQITRMNGGTPERQELKKKARELFDYWCEIFGKKGNTVYGEGRENAGIAMLKLFELDDLKKAVRGCKAKPYTGARGRSATPYPGAKKHTELKLILRDETYVERFMGYVDEVEAEAAECRRQGLERGKAALITMSGRNYEAPDVPMEYPGALRRVFQALDEKGCEVRGSGASYMAQCPAHDDRSPSLRIKEAADGAVLFFCLASCKTMDILNALGLEWRDIGGRGYTPPLDGSKPIPDWAA